MIMDRRTREWLDMKVTCLVCVIFDNKLTDNKGMLKNTLFVHENMSIYLGAVIICIKYSIHFDLVCQFYKIFALSLILKINFM